MTEHQKLSSLGGRVTPYWLVALVVVVVGYKLDEILPSLLEHMDLGTVLAAGIGVAGYILDARTSRQAEIRGLMVERARDQFEKLLVPVNVRFHSLMFSLYSFLGAHIDDAFEDDLTFEEDNDEIFGWDGDEEWTSADKVVRRRVVQWVWSAPDGIMKVRDGQPRVTAAAYELPQVLMKNIRLNPMSDLAVAYRSWARHEWVPCVERIAESIHDGMHLMETIPSDRLAEIFGPKPPMGSGWKYTPRGLFLSWWLSYARSWRALLEQWDAGALSQVRPACAFPVGIYFFVVEGQTIVGDLQKSLTGQSQMHGSHGKTFAQYTQ